MESGLPSQKRSALAHMLILVSGTGASQILLGLSAPLLTRLYTPHDFGVYAVALAIFNLMVAIVCLRYEMAIVLPRTLRSAANVAVLCVVITLIMSFASAVICVVCWFAFQEDSALKLEWWAALLIPWGVLSYGLQQILRMWYIRHRTFSTITHMILGQTLVTIGTQVVAGYFLSGTPVYLMLGTVLGYAAMVAMGLPGFLKSFPPRLLKGIRVSRLMGVARRYRRFPIFSMPYNFLAQAIGRVVLLILSFFVPTSTIGEFALAQRVVYLPVSVLTSAMGQVFYSRAAHSLGDVRLQTFVFRLMIAGILVFIPLIAFNFIFGEEIFRLAFGAHWSEAGRFASYLGIAAGFVTLTAWLDRVYDIRDRQHLSLLQEAIADGITVLMMTLVIYETHSAIAAVACYSFCVVGYYLIWTYVTFRIAHFSPNIYPRVISFIVGSAVIVAACGAVALFITPVQSVQAAFFAFMSAPLFLIGLRVGKNGLGQRQTILGPMRI